MIFLHVSVSLMFGCFGCVVIVTSQRLNYVQIFTDGFKVDEKVAAAAVSSVAPDSPFSCRLRDHCSIYTAELQAILFAVKQAYQSQESELMIFSDSLSALHALGKLNSYHLLMVQIQDMLYEIEVDQKNFFYYYWVFLYRLLDMLIFAEMRLLIELQTMLFAPKQVYQSQESKFMIFSDSACFAKAGKNNS